MASIALLAKEWSGNGVATESTLHQISPYIGRTKPAMARALIDEFSRPGDTIFDPYCGSATIVLEGWLRGRNVIGNDLNPYAFAITRAKLNPPSDNANIGWLIREISNKVNKEKNSVDLRKIPPWVRAFFHPETLRELVVWFRILQSRREWFLLGCLLGILHHQRPGFLSYPSSNAVPYLRSKKFPRQKFPQMYEYRDVSTRLELKAKRMLERVPPIDCRLQRICTMKDSAGFEPKGAIDVIITSPPYMRRLAYGRDNRLRLWFLGIMDSNNLDNKISPHEVEFLNMMQKCLKLWRSFMRPGSHCILILGDDYSRVYKAPLPEVISSMAEKMGTYHVESRYTESIPEIRRVRRECYGSRSETILVLKVK